MKGRWLSYLEQVRRSVYRLFMLFFSIICFLLLVQLIKSNDSPVFLMLGIIGFIGLLAVFRCLIQRFETVLIRCYNYVLAGFLLLYFVVQLVFAMKLEHTPTFDLQAIYNGAIEWAETGGFESYHDYYYWFPNNFGGLTFYYVLFSTLRFFGCDSYYVIACVANSLLCLLTMYCSVRVCETLRSKRAGLLVMVLFALSPVFWFMSPVFYTDFLSMFGPVTLFYLYLKLCDSKTRKQTISYASLFTVVSVVACFLKFTVSIIIVALLVCCWFTKHWKRFLCVLACVLVLGLGFKTCFEFWIYGSELDRSVAEVRNTPYLHWVMMGLDSSGGYNPYDYDFTRSFIDTDERHEALVRRIGQKLDALGADGLCDLIETKMVTIFGSGTLNQSDFLDDGPVNYNSLHEFLLYSSPGYGTYSLVCQAIFYSVITLTFVCGGLCLLIKRQDVHSLVLCVCMFGVMLFFSMWETSGRYVTNFVPIMYVIAVIGFEKLFVLIRGNLNGASVVSGGSLLQRGKRAAGDGEATDGEA